MDWRNDGLSSVDRLVQDDVKDAIWLALDPPWLNPVGEKERVREQEGRKGTFIRIGEKNKNKEAGKVVSSAVPIGGCINVWQERKLSKQGQI